MHELRKTSKVGYEDLMRELAALEGKIISHDQGLAMNLMVLEAKIRERFQQLEYRVIQNDPTYHQADALNEEDQLTFEDLQSLVPHELPPFPTIDDTAVQSSKRKVWETVGMAALLAVFTALGVFGLASILHLALTWVA